MVSKHWLLPNLGSWTRIASQDEALRKAIIEGKPPERKREHTILIYFDLLSDHLESSSLPGKTPSDSSAWLLWRHLMEDWCMQFQFIGWCKALAYCASKFDETNVSFPTTGWTFCCPGDQLYIQLNCLLGKSHCLPKVLVLPLVLKHLP